MAFNASVRFTGLCAFVPNKNDASMTCLLVNARFGGGLVDNPAHSHTPLVEFDVRDVEPVTTNMSLPTFEVINNNTGIWILNHEDIALRVEGEQNKFEFLDSDAIDEVPTEANKHLMAWVPHMRHVSTGAGPLRDECLGVDSLELRKRVAARLRVGHGRARTFRHTKKSGAYVRWEFKVSEDGPKHRTQVLAEEVELRLSGLDELILEAKRFDERKATRQLRLKNKTGQPELKVSFKNIELDEVSGTIDNEYPSKFEDFVYFYDLSVNGSVDRNIPHEIRDPHVALSRPICPGAVFDPHTDA